MIRCLPGLALLILLSGCGSLGVSPVGGGALSFLNTYEGALHDFERGRIMEARARILAMDKNRDDYPQAQKLLKEKVEPARLRLLRHYVSKAKEAERGRQWNNAMQMYAHASELSVEPAALKAKRSEMETRMRQLRFEQLIQRRRAEDAELLKWPDGYIAPTGVDPKDTAYENIRETLQELIEERADNAYSAARNYLRREEMPEMAYVEAESMLRLMPDSERSKKLMEEVKSAFPKALSIPKGTTTRTPVRTSRTGVSEAQVVKAMESGDWVTARGLARAYRREGGKNSDKLLKKVETGAEAAAAEYFQQGRLAFQKERLDVAVEHWSRAVQLTPDNEEYVDALRRATQLQERLRVLREGGNE